MASNRPTVSPAMRQLVFARSAGKCQHCETPIAIESFHCAHLVPHVTGGPVHESNLEAWCAHCNLTNGARAAGDNRLLPRDWQSRALNHIVDRIARTGSATVAAAPGAGKTVFAGLVFEALRLAELADRMVIFVPKRTLVTQWADSLLPARHLQLKTFDAVERPNQDGTVVTYQSLDNRRILDTHRQLASRSRTLLVFDEVHHLGERPQGNQPAWARNVAELAGSIDNLHVAGVLNLSGTLWRSAPSESISTVRYRSIDEGRLQSEVDFEVTTEELVLAGQLRPIDLYRLDSKVHLADYREQAVIQGNLSDLDDQQTRAAVARLGSVAEWRTAFVTAVLDRLEKAHRALGGYHAKALIVASSQDHARMFRDEADKQMRTRRLSPLALLAVSDEDEAHKTLKAFKEQKRVGVLCTVDMAGEGYDCPDIAVLGYATNKMTPLYIHQVIARAMRVTQKERELLNRPIPAAIVLPDAQTLVERLVAYLKPITAEVIQPDSTDMIAHSALPGEVRQSDMFGMPEVRYSLERATMDHQGVTVAYADTSREDFAVHVTDALGIELESVGVPAVYSPRFMAAAKRAAQNLRDARPFDSVSADVTVLEQLTADAAEAAVGTVSRPREAVTVSVISEEETAKHLQSQLRKSAGWWQRNGDSDIANFQSDINSAAGIPTGGRESASAVQLTNALQYAKRRILARCQAAGLRPPRF
jgi:superfamily II DNA or RNA helicase